MAGDFCPAIAGLGALQLGPLGAAALAFGVMQVVGAASGGRDPLQPLMHLAQARVGGSEVPEIPFRPVQSSAQLDEILRTAGRPVMLDFYADWCVSCKELERFTFSEPRVRERMSRAVLLRADVTANNSEHRELLRRFGLFGPPGILFFDASGREMAAARTIGFQDSDRFLRTLDAAGL